MVPQCYWRGFRDKNNPSDCVGDQQCSGKKKGNYKSNVEFRQTFYYKQESSYVIVIQNKHLLSVV